MAEEPLKFFTDEDAKQLPVGFLLTLTAPSGGGKSVFLQHLLSMPSMVNKRFGAAICVSPTSCLDCMSETDQPNQFACIPRKFHYDLSEHSLEDIIDMIKEHQKKMRREGRIQEILLVLDDILTSNHAGRLEAFTSWISIKRHYMCSIVAIMQTATAIPLSARRQVNGAFFSRPLMWQDKQIMQEWYLCRQFRGSRKRR